MSDKGHILVISQYFYPEQFRINDICEEWVKRGYRVTVITGIPNYPQGKFYDGYGYLTKRTEKYNGIDIIRLPLIPRGQSTIMMALNYLSFVVSGFVWSKFTTVKADKVFIYEVSPITQALPGIWYAKRRSISSALYVMDLWPENIEYAGGIKNKLVLGFVGKIVDYIYKNVNLILTSSHSFVEAIKKRGIDVDIKFWPQYAEEWYMPIRREEISIVTNIPNDEIFNIVFAGNIGVAQGLEILPRTALKLKEQDVRVRFNIIGDGRFKETLMNLIEDEGVKEYFNFIPKRPAKQIPEYIAACDAALLPLSANEIFKMTLPAKLQTYFACGIPTLVSADGEAQMVVNEAKAGFVANAGDFIELAHIIKKICKIPKSELALMGKNARKYYEECYEKQMLLDQIDSMFLKAGYANV